MKNVCIASQGTIHIPSPDARPLRPSSPFDLLFPLFAASAWLASSVLRVMLITCSRSDSAKVLSGLRRINRRNDQSRGFIRHSVAPRGLTDGSHGYVADFAAKNSEAGKFSSSSRPRMTQTEGGPSCELPAGSTLTFRRTSETASDY